MPAIVWLLLGGAILTAGDIVFKFWVEKPQQWLYAAGLAIYIVGLMFLVQSFKTQNIALASTVFVVFNVVTLALVSWFYFGEKLTPLAIAGVALALFSVGLLELNK